MVNLINLDNNAEDTFIWNGNFKDIGIAACSHDTDDNLVAFTFAEQMTSSGYAWSILENLTIDLNED